MIILISLGIILLMIEVFMPGAIFGILGILCLLGSIFVAWNEQGMSYAIYLFLVETVLVIMGFYFWLKIFPKTPFAKFFILTSASTDNAVDYSTLLNQEGVALSYLRPSGTATIGNQRVDVISEGDFIEKGQPLKVVKIEGNRILVQKISR
jgi:membrane-bound serine protease (ClpP class)